jgi:hypothetical protein
MELAIAMQDGGAGAGARHEEAARAARPTSYCLAAEPLCGTPRGGGSFQFQIFIRTPSLEIWVKLFLVCWPGTGWLEKLWAPRSRSSLLPC